MKKVIQAGLLTLALAGVVAAEEAKDESMFPGLHGEVEFTGVGYSGLGQSATFEEYRDLPQGGSADWLALDFENEEKTHWFELQVKDAGQEDMYLLFETGEYGKWKAEFEFNRIPHRFAYDYASLWSGIGSNELRVPDAVQAALEATAENASMTNAVRATQNANRITLLRDLANNAASTDEIMLQRDRFKLDVTYMACDPVTFGLEISHEERNGGRPIHGYVNVDHGLVEPIDYGTTSVGVWTAFDEGALHLKLMYEFTHFENREGSLSWDSPLVNTSSAAISVANTNPVPPGTAFVTVGAVSRTNLMDLYPNNDEHNLTLSGSYDLPWETRVDASATYFLAEQDDDLHPYTANQAMLTGAAIARSTATGLATTVMPFNGNDVASLPTQSANASYEQQHYSLGLTNRAIEKLEIRAGWRADNHDDDNERFTWAGRSVNDQSFSINEHQNRRLNYWRQTGGISGSYDLPAKTTLTLGYKFDNWDRHYDREADNTWEHFLVTGLDSHPVEAVQAAVSYEHSWRDGDYDPNAIFSGVTAPTFNATNPFFRRFDMVDRERDKLAAQLTFFPCDRVTPTAGYMLLYDDFDSDLGLSEEIRHAENLGVDTTPFDRLTFNGNATYEWSAQDLDGRQWSSGGAGDPYAVGATADSPSNWEALSLDRQLTFNVSTVFTVIQDKLGWENSASIAVVRERIEMDSEVGIAANDANLRDVSLFDISDADDSSWFNVKSQFRWKVRNNLTIVFGYMMERFDHQTAHSRDYEPIIISSTVPAPASGQTVQVIGPGIDPEDYINHAGFVTVIWEF